ncbi:baseplate J/gp47 family protein [Chengkuizengella axinellae]|uniref:Baseplate J/gp47 family protein n=1 Tax=Chengkuizengella axinellae TaxID=3064388 RepID=A0ABT9IXN2_9BACL|nr:baseplate J/gp47 family protein [Chengkuizengella sp. 2205SS18-9]MDP5273555.1 baseplate J/gp47 family protein [Chengkuizengella sp. 2205SS18-9]
MFEDQTANVILNRMLSKISNEFDKRQGSIAYDMVAPASMELEQVYIEMDNILNFGFADTTYGEFLERRCAEEGLYRKEGETDQDLYKRYQIKVSNPITSNNITQFKLWALEVPNVSDAKVYPIWNGSGTVKVVILASDRKPPSDSLVQEVYEFIENKRGVGVTLTVEGAAEVTINVTVSLTLKAGANPEIVKETIKENITSYLANLAFTDPIVRYTKIGDAILNAQDVIDYVNLELRIEDQDEIFISKNIEVADYQVAILGSITIN